MVNIMSEQCKCTKKEEGKLNNVLHWNIYHYCKDVEVIDDILS